MTEIEVTENLQKTFPVEVAVQTFTETDLETYVSAPDRTAPKQTVAKIQIVDSDIYIKIICEYSPLEIRIEQYQDGTVVDEEQIEFGEQSVFDTSVEAVERHLQELDDSIQS